MDGSDAGFFPPYDLEDTYQKIKWQESGNRNAQTTIKLQTGGKALSTRKNLFCLTGSATQLVPVKDPLYHPRSTPVPQIPVPAQSITVDGMALGSDGNLWRLYADNDIRDVTPRVNNMDYYWFTLAAQKYRLFIQAQ